MSRYADKPLDVLMELEAEAATFLALNKDHPRWSEAHSRYADLYKEIQKKRYEEQVYRAVVDQQTSLLDVQKTKGKTS